MIFKFKPGLKRDLLGFKETVLTAFHFLIGNMVFGL